MQYYTLAGLRGRARACVSPDIAPPAWSRQRHAHSTGSPNRASWTAQVPGRPVRRLAVRNMSAMMILTLLSIVGSPASAQSPQAWPIRCRGGGTMLVQLQQNATHLALEINFSRAPRGAEGNAPGPGQCAWIDRPVSANEPTSLHYSIEGARLSYVSYQGPNYRFLTTTDPTTTNLIRAIFAGRPFTVNAYNSGGVSAQLVISSIPQ